MILINQQYAFHHRNIYTAGLGLDLHLLSKQYYMESAISQQLFIYSSLRKGFHKDVFKYITHFFSFVSAAKANGILSIIDGEPVATPAASRFIKGELYKLNKVEDFSWVFGQLDDYEGLIVEPGERPLYRRDLTTVYKDDGSITSAWIYWYNGNIIDRPVLASGDISYNLGIENL